MQAEDVYAELNDVLSLLRDAMDSVNSLMRRMQEVSDRHTDDGDDFCEESSRHHRAGRKSRYI